MHPDSIGRTPPQSRALRQNENCWVICFFDRRVGEIACYGGSEHQIASASLATRSHAESLDRVGNAPTRARANATPFPGALPTLQSRIDSAPRLHRAAAQQGAGVRGGYEIEEGFRHLLLLRYRQHAGSEPDGVLQLLRQRADVVGAFDRNDDVDLLEPDFDVAFRHDLSDRKPVDELGL